MSEAWKKQFSHIPTLGNVRGTTKTPLIVIQTDSEVKAIAYSSDGNYIVSGSDDNSVRVWDALTGVELKQLNGHTSQVTSVAFSSDGSHIVSGSWDKSVRVWDALTGAELKQLNGHTDGSLLLHFHLMALTLSLDLMITLHIVSGSDDKSVRVWDALTSAELKQLNGHTDCVISVAFSPDGSRIVSGSNDNSVRVWDAWTGAELKQLNGHTEWVTSVAFSSDGSHIVSGSWDKSVRVWDALTGAELKQLNGHTEWVTSVAFSSDGSHIVSGSHDTSVRVWNALTGAELKQLNGHTESVTSVAFSPDGNHIVSGSWDNSVRVCNIDPGIFWPPTTNGWIMSHPGQNHLMWVPDGIREKLTHLFNCLIISQNTPYVIFQYSKLGTEWEECYTPLLL
ncbi:hypothetical protein M413DRAFT_33045 [Hebeloma cylindrosporum]|uniref:Uncharacterized protein n=1 Tax=Hebeloma cylindrosporum TaxID=76867 RepID=A0A0C2Y0Y6_HEBCY|nr:hypothetical protein M413DRAFT_33045 [Hebeloma cylindrosporum h7]